SSSPNPVSFALRVRMCETLDDQPLQNVPPNVARSSTPKGFPMRLAWLSAFGAVVCLSGILAGGCGGDANPAGGDGHGGGSSSSSGGRSSSSGSSSSSGGTTSSSSSSGGTTSSSSSGGVVRDAGTPVEAAVACTATSCMAPQICCSAVGGGG